MSEELNDILKVYESKIDQLQIVKATIQKAKDFYKDAKLPNSVLNELYDDFYSMEMAKMKDDPWEYFFYLYKQIETIMSYCVNTIIGNKRILEDIEQGEFDKKYGWENQKKVQTLIKLIKAPNKSIYFGYKLDLFYLYYVRDGGNSRLEELNFIVTNQIKDGRNYYGHGGSKPDEKIEKIKAKHDNNVYSFYTTYEVIHRKIINYASQVHEEMLKLSDGASPKEVNGLGLLLKNPEKLLQKLT